MVNLAIQKSREMIEIGFQYFLQKSILGFNV